MTDNLVEGLRKIKDEEEIKLMRKAANLTDAAFENIVPLLKTGVTEEQIAFELEMYVKKHGGTLAFDSIVAFGPNSSIPHHHVTDKKLTKEDQFIKLDFGAKIDGYCCDMTRTLITKSAEDRAKKIYETVRLAQKSAIDYLNNSVNPSGKRAYEAADKVITSSGFPSIPHGLGHGIGLEVHEWPSLSKRIDDEICDGMVFSVEPGIYIPGLGGVRIEDTVLFRNRKLEILTTSPKKLTEMHTAVS